MRNLFAVIATLMAFSGLTSPDMAEACDASCLAARKAANPLADVKAIMTDNTVAFNTGSTEDDSYNFQLQQVYAIPLGDANLVLRGIIPFQGVQPAASLPPGLSGPTPNTDQVRGIGDSTLQAFYAPKPAEGAPALGFGLQFSLPTRTDDALAGAGWGAGPGFVIFVTGRRSELGRCSGPYVGRKQLQHLDHPADPDLRARRWLVCRYNNVISYNWKAASNDEAWQVPLGLMAGRTIAYGDKGRAVDSTSDTTREPCPDRRSEPSG